MKAELDCTVTKNCPLCSKTLPVSEFGICRARKDGRNLYCKVCIRRKVTESRQALREYKSARKRYVAQHALETGEVIGSESQPSAQYLARVASKLSPIDRVRDAIKKNARTQKEIAQETKLGKDEIGDALANLLLWTREIRTEVVDNTRMYFINDSPELAATDPQPGIAPRVPRRKPDVPSSFSALQGLMPGKRPEGEPEKIGGWVAA